MVSIKSKYTTQTRITNDTTATHEESKKIKLSEDYFALCEILETLTNVMANKR